MSKRPVSASKRSTRLASGTTLPKSSPESGPDDAKLLRIDHAVPSGSSLPNELPGSQTAGSRAESVASLIRRLGPPPPGLSERLVKRFRDECEQIWLRGERLTQLDLEKVFVTSGGSLVVRCVARRSSHAEFSKDPITEWADAFRTRILQPPGSPDESTTPAAPPTRTPPTRTPPTRTPPTRTPPAGTADPTLPDSQESRETLENRFAKFRFDNSEAPQFSQAHQQKREALAELFAVALADRFGSHVLSEPTEVETVARPGKMELLERDRPFNWNLVLGVGTLVVVIAIAVTGMKVAELREERVAQDRDAWVAPREVANQTDSPSVETIQPPQSSPADDSIAETSPAGDKTMNRSSSENEVSPLAVDPREATDSADRRREEDSGDMLSLLDSVVDATKESAAAPIQFDPKKLRPLPPDRDAVVELLEKTFGSSDRDTTEASPTRNQDATLDEALARGDSNPLEDTAENPQDTDRENGQFKNGKFKFVSLPQRNQTDTPIRLGEAGAEWTELQFPTDFALGLRPGGKKQDATIVAKTSGSVIATIKSTADQSQFQWTDTASRESVARLLVHGRLRAKSGETTYLRRAISADPFALTLDRKSSRPIWELGEPIRPNITQLELELLTPDDIDLAWATPFNVTRPEKGLATAILTPPDGESVAIGVQIRVKCDKTLSCQMQYVARLDPKLPWLPFSMQEFEWQKNQLKVQQSLLEGQLNTFKNAYSTASPMDQRFMKRQRADLNRLGEHLELIEERVELLEVLAAKVTREVQLSIHLFVPWPDGSQTILETSPPASE